MRASRAFFALRRREANCDWLMGERRRFLHLAPVLCAVPQDRRGSAAPLSPNHGRYVERSGGTTVAFREHVAAAFGAPPAPEYSRVDPWPRPPFPSHRQLGKRIVPVLHAQGRGGLRSAGRRCGQQIQIPNAIQLAVQAGAESSKCGVLREHLETKNPRRSAGPDIRRGRTESAVQRFRLISTSSISAPVWNDFELAL